jgi:drug/metabolite transporter (DMT)-like permease
MDRKRHITPKIIAALIVTDLLETFAQFCFKKSVLPVGFLKIISLSSIIEFLKIVIHSPFLWVGSFSVFAVFVCWSVILSKIDLSVAVPVASASYITIPLVSVIFLGERILFVQWLGISFILLGIILVSLSTKTRKVA